MTPLSQYLGSQIPRNSRFVVPVASAEARPRPRRRGIVLALVAALICAAVGAASAGAERLAPGSLRLLPHTPGTGSTFAVNATFDQEPGTQLQAYDVDIARGLRIDPRAVSGRCSVTRARAGKCPRSSRIGAGQGDVRVQGPAVPQGGNFKLSIDFFLTPPQRHGDVAGIVLAGREPASGLGFALVGRIVPLARGRYGYELRFRDTAKELPAGYSVQLGHIRAHIGATRHSKHRTRHLLTTPRTCRPGGWPFLLRVVYTSDESPSPETEEYSGTAACSR
jgi:hypothetical protein